MDCYLYLTWHAVGVTGCWRIRGGDSLEAAEANRGVIHLVISTVRKETHISCYFFPLYRSASFTHCVWSGFWCQLHLLWIWWHFSDDRPPIQPLRERHGNRHMEIGSALLFPVIISAPLWFFFLLQEQVVVSELENRSNTQDIWNQTAGQNSLLENRIHSRGTTSH